MLFPCSPRIAEEHCSQSAVRTVRIAAVNVRSKENKNGTSGSGNGDVRPRTARLSDHQEFWHRAWNYRALAERDRESRRGAADHRRREDDHSHESLREDARRCILTAVAARRRTWGPRRDPHWLGPPGSVAGAHLGALVCVA